MGSPATGRTLYFDVETTGFMRADAPRDHPSQPWIVQLGAVLADEDRVWASVSVVIRAEGREMLAEATRVHGYDAALADAVGVPEEAALGLFAALVDRAEHVVAHNLEFDLEFVSLGLERWLPKAAARLARLAGTCTMKAGTPVCRLPGRHGSWKWPKLSELHERLFGEGFEGQHDALADVMATRRCHLELLRTERVVQG